MGLGFIIAGLGLYKLAPWLKSGALGFKPGALGFKGIPLGPSGKGMPWEKVGAVVGVRGGAVNLDIIGGIIDGLDYHSYVIFAQNYISN